MKIVVKPASKDLLAEFGINTTKDINASEAKEEQKDYTDINERNQVPLSSNYPGNTIDTDGPLEEKYRALEYPSPAVLLAIHNKAIREQQIHLHPWQLQLLEELGASNATAHSKSTYKLALCAANGSGKDAFIVAPFTCWFALVNIRALILITSSSGVQLSAQTENYIKSLCESVNEYYSSTIFRIRQRYIKCLLTGSEIRMFATDEAGKAEGYHPLEANAKMAIIVNEVKSVSEEIMQALRRCTGYSHWLNVSTPGAPKGSFHQSCKNWTNVRRIDYTVCPHMNDEERLEDLKNEGINSAYYRSKWLALFTSLDGRCIIPIELFNLLKENQPEPIGSNWPDRIGIDLSAGGDEAGICHTKGNRLIKEYFWHEKDTTITADKIDEYLTKAKIPKDHEFIFADDGGVGHAIIDNLVRRGWNIKRIINQARAISANQYGNRGAELWDRTKRFFEEGLFSPIGFSDKLEEQLTTRRYKEITKGKTFLESKKEAKSEGFHSPDRADAFVLSLTGLTIDDFLKAIAPEIKVPKMPTFTSPEEMAQWYEDNFKYHNGKQTNSHSRVLNSLEVAMKHQNN